ncbi:MAG TPA: protochlorophyllide oxidoreductase [Betaproteobacteria bacterium]|nr:protochlorophyllide oxidoreductase [Betaproteobacteria bacterium]
MSNDKLAWDEEALKKLDNIPAFIRKMVKGKIEKAALETEESLITVEFVEKMRAQAMG